MNPIRIDLATDDRLEPFRDIRERDLKGRLDCFVIEGRMVLDQALTSGCRMRAVLVSDAALAARPALVELDAPVYVASERIVSEVAGFHVHRGSLAIAERPRPLLVRELLARTSDRARVVVLLGISNHDNVGGVFRSAAALGAQAVLLDEQTSDPLYRKAVRVSTAATLLVPWAQGSREEILAELGRAGFRTVALTPRADAVPLRTLRGQPGKLALLLGAEGPGLEPAVIARADLACAIPITRTVDSLNVTVAASIALYELCEPGS